MFLSFWFVAELRAVFFQFLLHVIQQLRQIIFRETAANANRISFSIACTLQWYERWLFSALRWANQPGLVDKKFPKNSFAPMSAFGILLWISPKCKITLTFHTVWWQLIGICNSNWMWMPCTYWKREIVVESFGKAIITSNQLEQWWHS